MASGNASLAGAEFTFRFYDGQYATAAEAEASGAPTRTWVFKTDEDGFAFLDSSYKVSGDALCFAENGDPTLPLGTLLIQETKAPEGYLIDPTVYVRNITPDGTLEAVNSYNAPTVSEQVVTGRIQIVKHTDTGTTKVETPEVGATFNIYLTSAGSYDAAPANARAQITIDKDGFAVSPYLPYGLYTVEQTSGWEGSKLMEAFTVKIDENDKTYSYIINNERFYSYLKVVKVDAITGEAIPAAGVGFRIIDPKGQKLEWWGADTWYTDGSGVMKLPCELEYGRGYQAVEVVAPSGYVLADSPFLFDVLPENAAQEDGLTVITLTAPNSPTQISVAKVDYQGHFVPGATLQLVDAAGNVAAEWVTGDAPHTLYGLPIGAKYTLHESAAPEGWLLAEDMTFTVQDTAEVQAITMEDERVPELHTTATVDGSHESPIIGPVTLVDVIEYRHLVPGREYTVNGLLMDKSTGKALTDEAGQPVTSSVTFTPEQPEGEVEVSFTFDASLLAGKEIVVFEAIGREGRIFATHADIDDEGQTVRFPEIHTTATVEGSHEVVAIGPVTLVDVVAYRNLTPGQTYTVSGVLMDKSTGKALTGEDGKPITSSVTFTPDQPDGEVEVSFTFDAKLLGGKQVVVFESLYREDVLLAAHADIHDEGQTVRFQPAIGTVTIKDKPSFGGVQTGDSGVTVAVLGLLLSAAGLTYLLRRKRHS